MAFLLAAEKRYKEGNRKAEKHLIGKKELPLAMIFAGEENEIRTKLKDTLETRSKYTYILNVTWNNIYILIINHGAMAKEGLVWGWRNFSVAKSTYCSSGWPEFEGQHPFWLAHDHL